MVSLGDLQAFPTSPVRGTLPWFVGESWACEKYRKQPMRDDVPGSPRIDRFRVDNKIAYVRIETLGLATG